MLKWKKDGTVKCGQYDVSVTDKGKWFWRFNVNFNWYSQKIGWRPTESSAKRAAEKWLHAQVKAMQRDLAAKPKDTLPMDGKP